MKDKNKDIEKSLKENVFSKVQNDEVIFIIRNEDLILNYRNQIFLNMDTKGTYTSLVHKK